MHTRSRKLVVQPGDLKLPAVLKGSKEHPKLSAPARANA